MALEIERKFLVTSQAWRQSSTRSRHFRQGYLARADRASVRVRSDGEQAWLNIKAAVAGASRAEFEYPVPIGDAEVMLTTLCADALVEKTRFWVPYAEHTWEVDVFEGANAGLVVAEVELGAVDEPVALPPWVGREVTEDVRYYNNYLAMKPYATWAAND